MELRWAGAWNLSRTTGRRAANYPAEVESCYSGLTMSRENGTKCGGHRMQNLAHSRELVHTPCFDLALGSPAPQCGAQPRKKPVSKRLKE
jgi:hypothetical protein